MEKRFRALRLIGTIWKILAWFMLGVGIIAAFGVLLTLIFGGGVIGQYGLSSQGQWGWVFGVLGGIIGFVVMLIISVIWFVMLYAVAELIYLALSIEENTRATVHMLQYTGQARPAPPVS